MGILHRISDRVFEQRNLVSQRADGIGGRWTNPSTGQGGALDRHNHTTFVAPIPLDQASIDALMRFHAIARRIVTREPEDAVRAGYSIGNVPGTVSDAIFKAADGSNDDGTEGLGMLRALRKAHMWRRAYGGGAILCMVDDGREWSEPIDKANIRKVHGFEVFTRMEVTVSSWGLDPEEPQTFNRPKYYQIGARGRTLDRVHASRVIRLKGIDLPMDQEIAIGGWGGSVLDLTWEAIRNYADTCNYSAELVGLLTQDVFKTADMGSAIDAGDAGDVIARVEALRAAMGVMGALVIDKEKEDYQIAQRSLQGLKDTAEIAERHLVASSEQPRSVLFGEVPGGLNSGSNFGELEIWYGHVGSERADKYTSPARRMLALIMLSKEGPTSGRLPAGWTLEWGDLWVLSDQEKADLALKGAQRRSIDVQSGAVSADEVRQDPQLVELYTINPNEEAPAPPAEAPALVEATSDEYDDDSELTPTTGADLNLVPSGEMLVSGIEVAKRLGVSKGQVVKLAGPETFPAFRVGSRWRYAMSLVEQYIERAAGR